MVSYILELTIIYYNSACAMQFTDLFKHHPVLAFISHLYSFARSSVGSRIVSFN